MTCVLVADMLLLWILNLSARVRNVLFHDGVLLANVTFASYSKPICLR